MSSVASRAAVKRMRSASRLFATDRPQGLTIELERFGLELRRAATIFLTGAECPLACVMCDLWQHTNPGPTPVGSIPQQLQAVDAQCESAQWVKLYNASNFFDPVAVPPADYPAIIECCQPRERIIVENHPLFNNQHLREFARMCPAKLELAVGLESTDDAALGLLDKRFSAAEAKLCIDRWIDLGCDIRVFILIRPPGGPSGTAGLERTLRSAADAFAWGVRHVSLIPMRAAWGPVAEWVAAGNYQTPSAADIEWVAAQSQRLLSSWQSVSVDLWDWPQVRGCCDRCRGPRRDRLQRWNLEAATETRFDFDSPLRGITCGCAGV